ncbi:hypothetical protein [Arthrobacter subterraneus]|nr:hypothetical protein [Arthrobacter subterraneus]
MSARRPALILFGGVLGVILLVLLLLSSMGDPPPDPSTAPLEVVANSPDDGRCLLNREDVAAGVHEVAVITESSGATVVLRDEAGQTVFQSEDPQVPPADEEPEATGVELVEGQYTALCQYPDGTTGETPLTVTAD